MRQFHTFGTSRESKQTNSLTPRSRDLLEKLTDFHIVKKFHAFYGTQRFFTAFTSAYLKILAV